MSEMKDMMRKIRENPVALLESGLARLRTHMQTRSIGIISAATPGADEPQLKTAHQNLVRRLREHGYGSIQATGRSQWGPESSLVVPGITKEHLANLGNEFNQEAVIHMQAGGKTAQMHYLNKAGEKAGAAEDIGQAHFNTPNHFGITILKGLGFKPKDTRDSTRSFTFKEGTEPGEYVLEALIAPPTGQLNPSPRPYI